MDLFDKSIPLWHIPIMTNQSQSKPLPSDLDDEYTITTTKGSHTGSLRAICAWQAEMQGGMASIEVDGETYDVSDVEFDGGEMDDTIAAVTKAVSRGEECACGCGERTTRTVRRLRDQDVGTASALNWAELSIAPMRVALALVSGHDTPEGYVSREDEGESR